MTWPKTKGTISNDLSLSKIAGQIANISEQTDHYNNKVTRAKPTHTYTPMHTYRAKRVVVAPKPRG